MKLYHFPRSGNSREVRIVLAEKNIPYEAVDIHADKAAAQSAEFKKASPLGKVPAIVDGDVHMSEAFLINQYLDRRYPDPPLMPAEPARQEAIRDFVNDVDKKMVLNIGLLVIECLIKPPPQQREDFKEQKRREIAAQLADLERMLDGREYLFGEYSLADVAVTPHLAALPILGTRLPENLPRVNAWFRRIQARPSFERSRG
jgi:glutathione S-transferase